MFLTPMLSPHSLPWGPISSIPSSLFSILLNSFSPFVRDSNVNYPPTISQHPYCLCLLGTWENCRNFLFSQPSSSMTRCNIFTEGESRAITPTIMREKKELTRAKKEIRKTLESIKAEIRSYQTAKNSSAQLRYHPHPSHQYQGTRSTN